MKTKLFWRTLGVLWFVVVGAWGLMAEASRVQRDCAARRDELELFALKPAERPTVTLIVRPAVGKSGKRDVWLELDGVTDRWKAIEVSPPNQKPPDSPNGFPMSTMINNGKDRLHWRIPIAQALREGRRPLTVSVKWSNPWESVVVGGLIPENPPPRRNRLALSAP